MPSRGAVRSGAAHRGIEMIKTSFVLSVAILAAAPAIGSASAAEMPKELRGIWCEELGIDERYPAGSAARTHIIYGLCRLATDGDEAINLDARLRGVRCMNSSAVQKQKHIRPCRYPTDADGAIMVDARGYSHDMVGTDCKLLAITSKGNGRFVVRTHCHGGELASERGHVELQRWRLFNSGRRLEIRNAKALP